MTLDRITSEPNVMQGKPCIRGMRITASLVINLLANGMGIPDILREYPDLEEEDIRQCLSLAAWLMEDSILPTGERSIAIPG